MISSSLERVVDTISREHIPVLLEESIRALAIKPGDRVLDCTFGRGGHSLAFLDEVGSQGLVIGLDVDPQARSVAGEIRDERFRFAAVNFRNLHIGLKLCGVDKVDKVFFDLGVSSPQFDQAERGFSYRHDAPLDMRMNPAQSETAASILNSAAEEEIARILWEYGEERWAKRIASFVVTERKRQSIGTTGQLVELIRAAVPKKVREGEDQHPARRTFQALRIAVNDELGALSQALEKSVECLNAGGRLACISFHSLEDRIVKQFFVSMSKNCVCPPGLPQCVCSQVPQLVVIGRKPVLPTQAEIDCNPRSRSAKLRVAEKLQVF
jgi:16S rRNA (cytosine1402-N4)-methyltransferase